MKKLLIICILIIGIVFISGCTSEDNINSETSIDSQISQESDTKNPNLILKGSDVPGLKLGCYNFSAISESSYYIKNGKEYINEIGYQDVLPLGTRKVGESSQWSGKSGQFVIVGIIHYDSNSGLKEEIIVYNETLRNNLFEEYGELLYVGNPNIGEYCEYFSQVYNNQPEISQTLLTFVHKNYFVRVMVVDEKVKSKNEAIRIAKIIESRLD